ncbi:hypothetical protein [Arsenophonus nasoniae]|uniref:hypothetical protein n=1 Tax=Arsenophonus nasoniae TaxID=638 RepID=UPI0038790CA5
MPRNRAPLPRCSRQRRAYVQYGIVWGWGEFFTHPISSVIARVRLNYGKQTRYIKYAIHYISDIIIQPYKNAPYLLRCVYFLLLAYIWLITGKWLTID